MTDPAKEWLAGFALSIADSQTKEWPKTGKDMTDIGNYIAKG